MELCPLYEQFSAIAGRIPTKTEEAVFIYQDIKYPGLGSALFDLSPQKLDELVIADKQLISIKLLGTCTTKKSGSLPWV